MGMSAASCNEKECMLALGVTSDELRKYPMVTSRLRAYEGPQCYAHLDKDGGEYRAGANERTQSRAEGTTVASEAEPAVLQPSCWMCCDACGKWRLVCCRRCLGRQSGQEQSVAVLQLVRARACS